MNTTALHHGNTHHGVRVRIAPGPVTTRVAFAHGTSFAHGDTPAVMRSPRRVGAPLMANMV